MEPTKEKSEQDSLAPMQLDRLTIEEEVAGMNRGKGAQLLGVAMMVSALAVGGAWAMKRIDRDQAENGAAAMVAGLRVQHVEAFLVCILPEAPLSVFSSSERLHSAIETQTERYQKAYANTLASCEPKLQGLVPALAAAPVASSLGPTVNELTAAGQAIQDGAGDLKGYLGDARRPYDYVEVTAFIDRLARAAASYNAHDAALRELLMD
jgi:hypothetical protein